MAYAKAAAADAKGGFPQARKIWRARWLQSGQILGQRTELPTEKAVHTMRSPRVHGAHIDNLTQCEEPGQKEIWDLASEMWRMKTGKDLRPTIGQIMAGGATKCGDSGTTRVYKILITESAHLIWRTRNERVIQQTGSAPVTKIRNRWLKS
ncbi:hypothetical protein B0H13DRAFT_1908731 [Mycena leptocephala]|nr:hypothetical protein B0H13DRAFT_1908731 [Mycena leptocephala]